MRRLIGSVAALVAVVATSVSARAEPAVVPASADAVRVWYRNTEGCPDGAAFIALLQRAGRTASLAGVGDRVDFVVTVANTASLSTGRLERQSSERTVAIRDFSAASCAEVAEVLALSLDLALQPLAPAQAAEGDRASLRLGAQATLDTGLAHTALWGAAAFADLRSAGSGAAGRLTLRAAHGQRDAAVSLGITLLAVRPELCWSWALGSLTLGPCAGADLGLVVARGAGDDGRRDLGAWGAGVGLGRASWQLGRLVAIEGQAGLLLPFVRYRFTAVAGGEVTSSAALGLQASLGLSFLL